MIALYYFLFVLFTSTFIHAWQLPEIKVPFLKKNEEIIHKSYDIEPTGTLEIENIFGNITITNWKQPKLRIKITKLGSPQAIEGTQIKSTTNKKEVKLVTEIAADSKPATVHYEIMAPATLHLAYITTRKGSIKIKHMEGPISVSTQEKGNIEITGACNSIIAHATDNIKIKQVELPETASLLLESIKGTTELSLPTDINATIQATSNQGRVTTEQELTMTLTIPLNSKAIEHYLYKEVTGTFGKGGPKITLSAAKDVIITEH